MAYEIPKNLKYEEKILFNLTIWQSLWMGLFLALSFIIFTKTNLLFELKLLAIFFLVLFGIGFAFFDLKQHFKHGASFLFGRREFGYLDKEMKKFVEVKKILFNSIFLANGGVKAVVLVQPINFHILSKKHQEAIIGAYMDFLNSLDFPIQIVMRTVNLSLDDYLKSLELKVRKNKNEKLQIQFNEFRDFVKNFIEENSVKNRLFYIVIPADEKNEKKALSQLDIRAKLCMDKLKNCNLTSKRLGDKELVSLLSSYFEGFIETGNDYQSLISLLEKKHVTGQNLML